MQLAPAPPWREAARAELGFSSGEFVVAYSGRLVREKGLRELIDAARLLRTRRPEIRVVRFALAPPLPLAARTKWLARQSVRTRAVR